VCFVCGETRHFAKKCKNRKRKTNQQGPKSANVTIDDPSRSRYGNSLPSIFSVCQSNDWWIDTGANIMIVLISPCFHLTRSHEVQPS
jgi:hypothetical protein